eukprot:gene25016-31421_t
MRVERYRELENSQSAAESEANACIFHLSARASGLISHSNGHVDSSGDNDMTMSNDESTASSGDVANQN